VLTGVSSRADAEVNAIKPDGIYADLATLLESWE